MIIFLFSGILIGSVLVVFFLQNTTPIEVVFLNYELEGSLAIILSIAFAGGVIMTSLFLLPSLISDWLEGARKDRRVKQLEKDLYEAKKREDETKTQTNTEHTSSEEEEKEIT